MGRGALAEAKDADRRAKERPVELERSTGSLRRRRSREFLLGSQEPRLNG